MLCRSTWIVPLRACPGDTTERCDAGVMFYKHNKKNRNKWHQQQLLILLKCFAKHVLGCKRKLCVFWKWQRNIPNFWHLKIALKQQRKRHLPALLGGSPLHWHWWSWHPAAASPWRSRSVGISSAEQTGQPRYTGTSGPPHSNLAGFTVSKVIFCFFNSWSNYSSPLIL